MLDIDISDIWVRKASTPEDIQKVFDIRWRGYRKYYTSREEMIDEFDNSSNVTLLLATNAQDQAIGTMRILDQRHGKIELEQFLNLDSFLTDTEKPCAEATRFSIPNSPKSRHIKFALWKAFYRYCAHREIKTMLIWVRSRAKLDYKRLLFDLVGDKGTFNHPLLGDVEHHTYKLNVIQAADKFKTSNHPLHEFFFVTRHPNIHIE